ncbi:MAG: hypothetical protein J6Q58_04795, partial [Clostridia bacterium]|nr:hypothetical protein [Clostridia bacterium]
AIPYYSCFYIKISTMHFSAIHEPIGSIHEIFDFNLCYIVAIPYYSCFYIKISTMHFSAIHEPIGSIHEIFDFNLCYIVAIRSCSFIEDKI